MLIDFLDHVDSEHLYLVGDMIDGWRLKKRFYWPAAHNDVVWRLMKRAKRGTRVT
jgi:UDP-2,3-diacylglucosamine pyrophosphatase LpxH